jgi:PAS domain-containing protein
MILLKHWASYVEIPIWLTDTAGNLIYYNEPAEPVLGRRFDEAGEIPADQLAEQFVTTNPDGRPLPSDELPVVAALTRRVPVHRSVRIAALDGTVRVIEVTALPVIGQGGRHLGVLAFFWEPE